MILIVEGHGDVESLPILIRRISSELDNSKYREILRNNVIRISRSRLLRNGEVERAVQAASIKLNNTGDVLIVLDSDDDDPETLENSLNTRAKAAAPHLNVSAVVAVREYEAWLIHSIESLRGKRGLPTDISPPQNPDSIRGAKEWISKRMVGQTYSEIADCAALTAQMDLNLALNSDSFKKLCNAVKSCSHIE